jgi:hypothetical protein
MNSSWAGVSNPWSGDEAREQAIHLAVRQVAQVLARRRLRQRVEEPVGLPLDRDEVLRDKRFGRDGPPRSGLADLVMMPHPELGRLLGEPADRVLELAVVQLAEQGRRHLTLSGVSVVPLAVLADERAGERARRLPGGGFQHEGL